jgi:DNA-binding FrmR family transcriptional regulator
MAVERRDPRQVQLQEHQQARSGSAPKFGSPVTGHERYSTGSGEKREQTRIVLYQVWYNREEHGIMGHTIKDKKELLLRAKRILGQVEALVRALTEERDCSDVLQLMSAARGAMNSLMAELLEGHIRSHVLDEKQKPTSEQVAAADEVIAMVKSYLK